MASSNKPVNNFPKLFVVLGLALSIFFAVRFARQQKEYKLQREACIEKLEGIYTDISGFGISEIERNYITAQGGSHTYGEIIYPSMEAVINRLEVKKEDVFYDLGSGVGKFPAWVHLTTDIKKSVGIELSETRYEKSMQALGRLEEAGLLNKSRTLSCVHGDITEVDFSDATIIFMCATCFSEPLLQKLVDIFLELTPGLRIVTLKKLPEHPRLVLIKEEALATSWSKGSPFRYYKLLAPATA